MLFCLLSFSTTGPGSLLGVPISSFGPRAGEGPHPQATQVLGEVHPTTGSLPYRTIKVEVYDWDRDGR